MSYNFIRKENLAMTDKTSDTPRTDAVVESINGHHAGFVMPQAAQSFGSICDKLVTHARTLERELAEARSCQAQTTVALVHAGIPAFGTNKEGVEKLALRLSEAHQKIEAIEEDREARRHSLAQEIHGVLKTRGHFSPGADHASDLIGAVARAIESKDAYE